MRQKLNSRRIFQAAVPAILLALTAPTGGALGNGPRPAATYYDSAVRLIEKRDFRGAIIELKNALQADPNDVSARLLLGRTYLSLDQGNAAAQELLRARRDGAGDRFVLVPLGRAYLSLGLFERTLKEIQPTGQDRATAAEIEVIRGHARLALHEYDAAERSYRSASLARPDDPQPLVGLARIMIARGDFGEAAQLAAAALKSRPGYAAAWHIQGVAAQMQGNHDAAIEAFDRVLQINPEHADALLDRAKARLDTGRYEDAEKDIVKVRGNDRRLARAAYMHAVILTRLGRKKEAEDALIEAEQSLREMPADLVRSHPPTMLLFGVISYFRENYDAAFGHLSAFLERTPHHADARKMLASIALHRGQAAQAIEFLKPLARDRQNDVEFLILYSDALIRTGRYEQASGLLDKATRIAAPGSAVLSRLLRLRLAAGDNEEAIDLMKAELARNPQTDGLALTLATTQVRQRDFEAALATITPILARHPDDPAAHTLAGGAYLGLKNAAAARASFETALKLDPGYAPALENLGKLEAAAGNPAGARRHFLHLLDRDPENGKAMSLLAELERRAGNIDGAIGWLEKARTSSRDGDKAALKLIDVFIVTGRAEEAVRLAEGLHRREPGDLAFLAALGRARLAARQVEPAAELFGRLARTAEEAGSTEWLYMAALLLARAHDRDSARLALENVLKLDARHIPAQAALFNMDLAAGKLEEAMARADRLAALAPGNSTGDELHGRLYMRMQRYDDAVRSYSAAFAKSPGSALAVELYEARRMAGQDALGFASDWAKKNPQDRMAQRLLAGAYTFAGRVSDGIALYERLLKDEPGNIEYLNNIAILYQRKGDPRAADFAKRAYESSPAHGGLMDTYGWILVQQGQSEQGLKLLRNAHARLPDLPEIRYHMAVALDALGRRDAARRELRAALDYGQSFDGIDAARSLLKKLTGAK